MTHHTADHTLNLIYFYFYFGSMNFKYARVNVLGTLGSLIFYLSAVAVLRELINFFLLLLHGEEH